MHSRSRSKCAIGPVSLLLAVSIMAPGCGDDSPPNHPANTSVSTVAINELQSRNSSILSDTGKKSDWVELYNDGESDVSLEGYFISDDKNALLKAELPAAAVVPALGFLVLWLDDTLDTEHSLHFPFKLSGDGENFYFVSPEGKVIRKLTLPADPTGTSTTAPDVSYGAYPDGSYDMGWCRTPTPGKPNAADCGEKGDAGI